MKLFEKLKKMFVSFEDVLSVEHACISCNREILDGSVYQMCDKCRSELEKIDGRLCLKCGEMLADGKMLCEACKDFDYAFNSSRSMFYYNDASSRIVKGLKYGGRKYYAKHIAKMMTEDRSVFENIDLITFVPISDKGRKLRGFNQAEEIANEISKIVGISVKKLLIKTKDHKHQAGLNQKDRLENLKGTFSIDENLKSEVKGKRILIVDDVFTTGATLSECALTLKLEKPKVVNCLTFAKTKLNSIN